MASQQPPRSTAMGNTTATTTTTTDTRVAGQSDRMTRIQGVLHVQEGKNKASFDIDYEVPNARQLVEKLINAIAEAASASASTAPLPLSSALLSQSLPSQPYYPVSAQLINTGEAVSLINPS